MALVPLISDEDASPETRVLFDACRQMFDRVANATLASANRPRIAQGVFGVAVALPRGEISEVLDACTKALVIFKTSMLNACTY